MAKYSFLFAVLFSKLLSAQQVDSMMNVYATHAAPEKIHIHFDKNIYNRGETIWYKAYILQGSDSVPASANLYMEWYDAAGKPLSQTRSPIVLAAASGSFDVPMEYGDQVVQVKAFTQWMLNDDVNFIYRRELPININSANTARPGSANTTVAVFPEGGFLIEGLRTRVAFKAANKYGNPVFVKGILLDNRNNVLDSITVQHDGMGNFYLQPMAAQAYQIKWVDEFGTTGSTIIPAAKTQGAKLAVTKIKDRVVFQVERTEAAGENFKKMTLLVHMNRVGLYKSAIDVSERTSRSASLLVNDLPTGLLQFTLFTEDGIPVAERVIFINNNTHALDVQLAAPLISTEKRSRNTIEIIVPDTMFANMSMAVTDADIDPPAEHTIFSDILLTSEIKGKVHNPAYYFSNGTDSVAAHLDLLMLTNGWRRFDWDRIKANLPPKIEYPADTAYMKMYGSISPFTKKDPPLELSLVVTHKDRTRQFISVPVQDDGMFVYPGVFYDTAQVLYSVNNNTSVSAKPELKLSNGLLNLPATNGTAVGNTGPVNNQLFSKQVLDRLLREQDLLNKLLAETTLKEVTVTTEKKTRIELLNEKYSTGFFKSSPTRKEYVYDLTDPTKVNSAANIVEYMQGRIPGLYASFKTSSKPYIIEWRNFLPEFYLNEINVELVAIMGVPMETIAMIKAFPPPFMFATGGGRGGAIAIYTKKGKDDDRAADANAPGSILLAGYTKFREFYNPSYENAPEENAKADNRTTLYWNPNLFTNKTQQRIVVDFYNNDFTKKFKAVLEGISSNGKLIRVVKTIGN